MQITPAPVSLAGAPNRVRDLAVFGDSRPAQNTDVAGGQIIRKYGIGYAVMAEILSGRTLRFDETLNFGVAGDTTTQALARIGTMLASSASAVLIDIGINDLPGSISFATTQANYLSIVQQTLKAGKTPLLLIMTPFNSLGGVTPATATTQRQAQRISQMIRDIAATTTGCILIDPTENLADNALGTPIGLSAGGTTAVTYDGLHHSLRGAFWVGKAIADAMSPSPTAGKGGAMFPTRLRGVLQNALDLYNATDNTTGSRIAASILTGTTGGTLNTGASGVVPAGMNLGRSSGTVAAVTGSVYTADTSESGQPINKFRMVVTAPGGGTGDSVVLGTTATFAPGDVAYASCDIDVSGITADSFRGMRLNIYNGGQVYYSSEELIRSGFVMPNQSWSGTLRTPNLTVPAGTTTLTLNLEIFLMGSVASAGVTINVGRLKFASVS